MDRLVYRKPQLGGATLGISASAWPAARMMEVVTPSVEDVLRERISFVRKPQPVSRRTWTPAEELRWDTGPLETGISLAPASDLYHGLIEGEASVRESLRILEDLKSTGRIDEFAIESRVGPPRPLEKSPLAGRKLWPFERWIRKDFRSRQTYLEDSPSGVGARQAWTFEGGRGQRVNLVDLELGFHREHEDLRRVAKNAPLAPDDSHGTMSLGVCCADDNDFGITGIAPGAEPWFESVRNDEALEVEYPLASAAIWKWVERLCPGDVILLELEGDYRYSIPGAKGYLTNTLPIERSPDVAAAIADAQKKSIYVVQAAGNGGLDLGLFGLESWTGAIMVGAGDPETHKWVEGTNYGCRVDVQGWGRKVVSTASSKASATLSRGRGLKWRSQCYTQSFDGTSSATAMVAGIVACLSGIARASGVVLTPREMRDLLADGDTSYTGDRNIGPVPDLEKAITSLQIRYGPLKLAEAA